MKIGRVAELTSRRPQEAPRHQRLNQMKLRDGLAGRLQKWGQIAFHPNPQLDLQV